METKIENIRINTTKLDLSKGSIIQLNVIISGSPSIREVLGLMKRINEVTDDIKEKYISVTDLSNLDLNNLFRSLIVYGMEKTYKTFLAVKNKAEISFVILKDDEKAGMSMRDSLKDINQVESDYNYKYIFIQDMSQVKPIVEKVFLKN